MPDYSQGKIYRLTCDNPELIYYGSTVVPLRQRLKKHRAGYKNWANDNSKKYCSSFKLFEAGGIDIELVLECPCENNIELRQIEQTYLDNDICINEQRAFRTKEQKREQSKETYERIKNTDKYKEYHKKYNN